MNANLNMFPDGEAVENNESLVPYSYEILSILPQKETKRQVPRHRDMLLVLSGRPAIMPEAGRDKGKRLLLPIGKPVYITKPYKIYSMGDQARVLRVSFPSEEQ